jgi:hypothetical protein
MIFEVSPYFFQWASHAAEKYYGSNEALRDAHVDLLNQTRFQINSSNYESPFQNFSSQSAGRGYMYGICLQHQYLDPQRYPSTVRVRNGFRPFLFRSELLHLIVYTRSLCFLVVKV